MFVDMEAEVDGHICRLSDYVGKGRYVWAEFWGSTCQPCLTQIPKLNSIYKKYKERGLTVLGMPSMKMPRRRVVLSRNTASPILNY